MCACKVCVCIFAACGQSRVLNRSLGAHRIAHQCKIMSPRNNTSAMMLRMRRPSLYCHLASPSCWQNNSRSPLKPIRALILSLHVTTICSSVSPLHSVRRAVSAKRMQLAIVAQSIRSNLATVTIEHINRRQFVFCWLWVEWARRRTKWRPFFPLLFYLRFA